MPASVLAGAPDPGGWRRRVALRWVFRRSGSVAAVSRATRTDLVRTLEVETDRIEVIPNGTPRAARGEAVGEELGVEPEERLVIYAMPSLSEGLP